MDVIRHYSTTKDRKTYTIEYHKHQDDIIWLLQEPTEAQAKFMAIPISVFREFMQVIDTLIKKD